MEMVKQEPKRALMAGDLGLTTYQNFFQEVFNYLKDDGVIAIEHGYLQKELLEEIILSYRKNAEITALKDLAKKDRYLIIRWFNDENQKNWKIGSSYRHKTKW